MEGGFDIARLGEGLVLKARGPWLVATASELDRALTRLTGSDVPAAVRIDLAAIDALDTAGAWLVLRTCRAFERRGIAASIENVPAAFAPLFDQVAHREPAQPESARAVGWPVRVLGALESVGKYAVEFALAGHDLLGFFGLVSVTGLRTAMQPTRLRWTALMAQIDRTGVTALPIVGLLAFLIGVVISYQGADQLRRFGAEIFTVNLLGVSVLRELGVLITAIIVAGRSGSAFAAEIGTMQVNEEVDAMRTLGLDPVEVLVLPRLFGLVLALPLLTVYANFMALLGGALMVWATLGIPLVQFTPQLHAALSPWTFWIGLIKAPFFAATIAIVGCHSGLRVSRSAESVGRLTTAAVVESIFLVIVIDAVFSILFSRLGI
jgi:phospholipid/cholesterol/gamma-HCH transport system permease protein